MTPEDVARAIVEVYTLQYAQILATVASKWADIEPVVLEDYKSIAISAAANMLPPAWESPMLRIATGQLRTLATQQQYMNKYGLDVSCISYFRYGDARQAALAMLRHQEAHLMLFESNHSLGLGGQSAIVPNSIALLPSEPMITTTTLTQGLLARFTFGFYGAGI